jgi:amino acid transporter
MSNSPNSPFDASYGLRAGALSQAEIIAQSMANVSPTAGPAMVVPLVIASSGDAAWITFLVATAAVILIALNINLLANSSASPGSLYGLVREHFGRWPSIIAGWSLLIAYIATAAAVTGGLTNYFHALVSGSPQPSIVFTTIATTVSILAACWLAYRDVRLSVQLMLWLETISIALILVLFFLPGQSSALHYDRAQLAWKHFDRHQVQSGLVLAIFSFVGFESATAMGAEAADPLRTIPRAVWMTALFSGAFFLLSAYSENLGLKGMLGDLSVAGAPLQVMARLRGMPHLAPLLSVGCLVSFFACTLASITAGARTLFLMSRDGFALRQCGIAHPRHRTPHQAVLIISAAALVMAVFLCLRGTTPFDLNGWLGTLATYGFLIAYGLACLAAPLKLQRQNSLSWSAGLVAAAALLIVGGTLWLSFDLSAAPPNNWLPFLYVGLMLAGLLATGISVRSKRVRTSSVEITAGRDV